MSPRCPAVLAQNPHSAASQARAVRIGPRFPVWRPLSPLPAGVDTLSPLPAERLLSESHADPPHGPWPLASCTSPQIRPRRPPCVRFPEQAELTLHSRPSRRLLPRPGTLFSRVFTWSAPACHDEFNTDVPFSRPLSRRAPTAVAALHHATPGALFPARPPPAVSAGVTDVMGTAATVAAGSLTAPTRSRHAYVIPHAFIVGLLAPERKPQESRGRDVLVHSVPPVPGRMPGSSRLLNEHRVTPRAEM